MPAIYCNWPKQGNESIKSLWVWSKLGSHFCFTEIKISVSGTIQLFFWIFFISTCLSGLCCYAVIVLVWRPWWEVLLAGVHCSAPVTISHCCITVEMLLIDIPGLLYIWEQLLWNRTLRNISMLCWSNLCSTLLFRITSVHSRQRKELKICCVLEHFPCFYLLSVLEGSHLLLSEGPFFERHG